MKRLAIFGLVVFSATYALSTVLTDREAKKKTRPEWVVVAIHGAGSDELKAAINVSGGSCGGRDGQEGSVYVRPFSAGSENVRLGEAEEPSK